MKNITIKKHILICLFLFFFSIVNSQEKASIKGSVLSESGNPLEAVNLVIEGTTKGTITESNGTFIIVNIPSGKYKLIISSIGYETYKQRISLNPGDVKNFDIKLKETNVQLSEIYIVGDALNPDNRTITVNEVNQEAIQKLNVDLPIRIIEQIPGVDLSAYSQGGVADQFSIRGFGGGGHEGEAGVQIDGVSLNEAEGHADGYADLNILIPLNLESVKVYKGPSSALYGRFSQGGTLAIETRKGGNYQNVGISGGAFNTLNSQYALGKEVPLKKTGQQLNANLAFQLFQSNGYAENSDQLRGNITGRLGFDISNNTDIALSLRGHSSVWDAAGYITEEQVDDYELRTEQDEYAENDGGNKEFYAQRIDFNHNFNDNLRMLVFGYAVQQDFTRFAKFGFTSGGQTERFNTRNVYAAGANLNGRNILGTIDIDWIAGTEYYSESTDRKRWESSYRVRGDLYLDRQFDVQTASAFGQGEFNFSKYLRMSVGLRYDQYFGSFTNSDPDITQYILDMSTLSNLSPKIGLKSTIAKGLDLRASISQGFTLPNSTLKYESDSGLDPSILWQYELGAKYISTNWLTVDVVGWMLNTTNEILESPSGSGDYVNIGETSRIGIESEVIVTPIRGLEIRGTYSFTDTEIKNNPDESLEGNEVTNVPKSIATFDVSYALKNGLGSRMLFRNVGPYFTNSENTGDYKGYSISNFFLFYNFNQQSSNKGRVFLEIRNVFDSLYSEVVFGDPGSQMFTPAPTRNLMLGINYNF
ncbi:TonB-dependent receptor [Cellulophaga baltica]|uniref:TonB-dependent receptor n=1 Tax=Cellulophaga TaxID=104264 RepID=UPI001C073D00|nr:MULTISPECIES: TonB-dependent receptor [Cellulophaga]MBU2997963.1 TonB-dependent receptor [Cellulophaga baltica]MDO6769364.1 TonB-dependent receptor [Cellulophaga sp. 1_MG-2023]